MPVVVNHLAYSKDGHYLAATLSGKNGIQVFDVTRGYTALPSDGNYADNSAWADFDAADRLVTASFDGFVRLYASGHYDKPVAKQKPRQDDFPYSVAFSPADQRVAVAFPNGAPSWCCQQPTSGSFIRLMSAELTTDLQPSRGPRMVVNYTQAGDSVTPKW